jgi:hypothetical protein
MVKAAYGLRPILFFLRLTGRHQNPFCDAGRTRSYFRIMSIHKSSCNGRSIGRFTVAISTKATTSTVPVLHKKVYSTLYSTSVLVLRSHGILLGFFTYYRLCEYTTFVTTRTTLCHNKRQTGSLRRTIILLLIRYCSK